MAVTHMEGHVDELIPIDVRREVECVYLIAVMRDPAGAATLCSTDLNREGRSDLRQKALDCRSLAGRHLPIVIGERVHWRPHDTVLAGVVLWLRNTHSATPPDWSLRHRRWHRAPPSR